MAKRGPKPKQRDITCPRGFNTAVRAAWWLSLAPSSLATLLRWPLGQPPCGEQRVGKGGSTPPISSGTTSPSARSCRGWPQRPWASRRNAGSCSTTWTSPMPTPTSSSPIGPSVGRPRKVQVAPGAGGAPHSGDGCRDHGSCLDPQRADELPVLKISINNRVTTHVPKDREGFTGELFGLDFGWDHHLDQIGSVLQSFHCSSTVPIGPR